MKLKNCEIGKEVKLKGFDGVYEIMDIDNEDPLTKVRIKDTTSHRHKGLWVRHKDIKAIEK